MTDRYAMRAARQRWEAAIRRDVRSSLPKGDALLELYATKTADQIAAEYFCRVWWVRECIKRARK